MKSRYLLRLLVSLTFSAIPSMCQLTPSCQTDLESVGQQIPSNLAAIQTNAQSNGYSQPEIDFIVNVFLKKRLVRPSSCATPAKPTPKPAPAPATPSKQTVPAAAPTAQSKPAPPPAKIVATPPPAPDKAQDAEQSAAPTTVPPAPIAEAPAESVSIATPDATVPATPKPTLNCGAAPIDMSKPTLTVTAPDFTTAITASSITVAPEVGNEPAGIVLLCMEDDSKPPAKTYHLLGQTAFPSDTGAPVTVAVLPPIAPIALGNRLVAQWASSNDPLSPPVYGPMSPIAIAGDCHLNPSSPKPVAVNLLDPINSGSQPISIPSTAAGTIRLCVNGVQAGLPVVATSGKTTSFSSVPLTSGEVVVIQSLTPGTGAALPIFGEFSPEIGVDACASVGSNANAPIPILSASIVTDQTFTGSVSQVNGKQIAKFVRLCVIQNPTGATQSDARQEIVVPVNENGIFTATLSRPLKSGESVVAQSIATDQGVYPRSYGLVSTPVIAGLRYSHLFGSFIAGEEQSGYSSDNINTNAFVSAYIRSDYFWDKNKNWLTRGLALSGRVRLLSAPAQTPPDIIATLASPTGTITQSSLASVGAVIDYSIGPEWRLAQHDYANGQSARFSLIAGMGETTPLSTATPTVFAAPIYQSIDCTNFLLQNPNLTPGDTTTMTCVKNPTSQTGYTAIAYTQQKRTNFLFKWGAGARFTRVYPARGEGGVPYAGMLDLTLGQDQSVTGGRTRGVVFRVDAQYPLPFQALSFLYVFGSSSVRLGKNQIDPIINLGTLTTPPTVPSASVLELPTAQPDRDFYRIGVGVNILDIFSSWFKSSPTPAAP